MTANAEAWTDIAAVFAAAAAPRLPLDEWATKYRRVVGGPMAGPWNHRNVPMAVEPMRAVSDRRVRQVTLCTPAQLMKSEFAINVAIWTAANGDDVLFYEPDREVLAEFLRDRVRPALIDLDANAIAGMPDGRKQRDSVMAIRLAGGGKILGLTPQMKTGKSAYTAPCVVLDEIDKMADPSMITVARSRTTMYGGDGKIVSVSTPTVDIAGAVWRLWSEGSRGRWMGRCAHCGELARVDWSRVKFQRDEDGFWLPKTAEMSCEQCGSVWSEPERQRTIRSGEFVHDDPDSQHRSFHVPGTAHVRFTLRDIVEEGASAYRGAIEDGTWETYQLFVNERLGEPWTDDYQGLSARRMARTTYSLGSRGKKDLGELDRRAVLVTAGADVGGRDIRCEFVAWGIEPRTGQVLAWGLQYRVIGGAPDDDIEDPDLWRQFFGLIDASVWRHAAYPDRLLGAHRVLVDAGHRPDVVRDQLKARFAHEVREANVRTVHPYGARILPSIGRPNPRFDGFIELSEGLQRSPKQVRRFPAAVGLHTVALKDAIYEMLLRDRRLPEGAPRQCMWPVDQAAKGYTPAYFREFSNEVRALHRTPQGKIVVKWEAKAGQARINHAWDARVYATGAAIVHCQRSGSAGLHAGLLARAIGQGAHPGRWTDDEIARMRKHLAVVGGNDYSGGDGNVVRLQ